MDKKRNYIACIFKCLSFHDPPFVNIIFSTLNSAALYGL